MKTKLTKTTFKEYNNLILNHENAEADDCIAIYINYIKNELIITIKLLYIIIL